MKAGDVVFWHDPDCNVGSGVGKVVKARSDVLSLDMLSGSNAEVPPHEVTPVSDTDVVGVDENDLLLFYNSETHAVYTDGHRASDGEYHLDEEEQRRVEAIRESMEQ